MAIYHRVRKTNRTLTKCLVNSGVTGGLSQGGKTSLKRQRATVGGPLANCQEKSCEMIVTQDVDAFIKPVITGTHSEKR